MRTTCLLILIILVNRPHTHGQTNDPSTEDQRLLSIVKSVISSSKNCTLITIDENGVAKARVMDPLIPDEQMVVWLGTNPKSRKVMEIKSNPQITVHYFDPEDPGYASIYGKAYLINNASVKEAKWKSEWQPFYKNPETDLILIKVVPESIELISTKHKILGDTITWQPPKIIFNQKN